MSLKKRFFKTKDTCKVTFRLPKDAAADGKKVLLLGDFNEWNQKEGIIMKYRDGEFSATVDLQVGREYEYKYLIDDTIWENDWAPDKYATSPLGVENSVVITNRP